MKLINQKAEYWPQENLYKQIERCARVCYKSEDKITDDSAKKMVDRLIQSGHLAMLEHGTVYLKKEWEEDAKFDLYLNDPYSKVVYVTRNIEGAKKEVLVTTNLRVIIENHAFEDLEYQCEPTMYHYKRYTMFLTTSIGIVRELLRHRKFSFANESTRYCNYSKDKFDNNITCIIPHWTNLNTGVYYKEGDYIIGDGYFKTIYEDEKENIFLQALLYCEQRYMDLLKNGCAPQQARDVLSLATKSDIVMTGFEEDWAHFFNLRLDGSTGAPHPDMKILAQLIGDEFYKNNIEV
jgi:thymidylate synthase (FAD)